MYNYDEMVFRNDGLGGYKVGDWCFGSKVKYIDKVHGDEGWFYQIVCENGTFLEIPMTSVMFVVKYGS